QHSYLAFLFPMPANYGTPQSLSGLQTRASVQRMIGQSLGIAPGSAAISPQQYIQQQMCAAQTQLNTLKDKINKLGGGSSDITMPDFKPNEHKTKSFLKRLEYGFNVQSEKSRHLIPVTSDLALTIGYKINDKSIVGLGASYKIGWGSGWNNISLTSEGIGFRSYVDIKAKGSLWISGGWEYNYLQRVTNISTIKDLDVWQKSGMLGLSKKYKVGKKEGKMQVLWDFMSYRQVPVGQAIKFRIWYSF
ncbi:MAG TPA: hypothetical protein PLA68_10050, partial [Panacibacter sp.]|nr:hypothetical protein [Panacibacter sp.]